MKDEMLNSLGEIGNAPTFRPTPHEFKDGPIAYINKIRSIGEQYGIIHIIPPDNFNPQFAVDPERFRFKPRTQRINELDASRRTRLNYTDFGFSASENEYTLAEFEKMADQFKRTYFDLKPTASSRSVPLAEVEKEFWKLASTDNLVTVEYGADLHCKEFGSGFPTEATRHRFRDVDQYIKHPWNLNNTPVAEGSVFKYINTNISGMIVPWLYVGMCFSTFCWHNEDHWTYSISYLHRGEPKTWYGVPGSQAEAFERCMKQLAPNLFESQPDLLHQLVTICHPQLLKGKVRVSRLHQHAGEFVVTFPRAYHTGFNQGSNIAEAVNFAPADWLRIGRNCVDNYASVGRYPVFSHDELICKMANDPSILDYDIAMATYQDMVKMCETEKVLRSSVLDWGVTKSDRLKFEREKDDDRICSYCKTTCFLSALSCLCDKNSNHRQIEGLNYQNNNSNNNNNNSSNGTSQLHPISMAGGGKAGNSESDGKKGKKLVCLSHKHKLCQRCEPKDHTLLYRYTMDELPIMLRRFSKYVHRLDSRSRCNSPVTRSNNNYSVGRYVELT